MSVIRAVLDDAVTAATVVLTLRLLGVRVQLEDATPIWRWRPWRRSE